jgi:hypothetical protein
MIAVAVVALLAWARVLWRVRTERLRTAMVYAAHETFQREAATSNADIIEAMEEIINSRDEDKSAVDESKRLLRRVLEDRASSAKLATRYARLRQLYLRAASRPWLPVPPDPPEPK